MYEISKYVGVGMSSISLIYIYRVDAAQEEVCKTNAEIRAILAKEEELAIKSEDLANKINQCKKMIEELEQDQDCKTADDLPCSSDVSSIADDFELYETTEHEILKPKEKLMDNLLVSLRQVSVIHGKSFKCRA
ncbi:MAG: hypothetical protein SFT91_02330 [Rickettsiaceae bacterium]|nr:hypothetical protein [Rickettsiaceae bacterium]